jgi:hypothetical protein
MSLKRARGEPSSRAAKVLVALQGERDMDKRASCVLALLREEAADADAAVHTWVHLAGRCSGDSGRIARPKFLQGNGAAAVLTLLHNGWHWESATNFAGTVVEYFDPEVHGDSTATAIALDGLRFASYDGNLGGGLFKCTAPLVCTADDFAVSGESAVVADAAALKEFMSAKDLC